MSISKPASQIFASLFAASDRYLYSYGHVHEGQFRLETSLAKGVVVGLSMYFVGSLDQMILRPIMDIVEIDRLRWLGV